MNVEKYRKGLILHYEFTFGKLGNMDNIVGFQNILYRGNKAHVIESFFIEV